MFFDPKIFSNLTLLGLILCEKSIARISNAWKRFPDPESKICALPNRFVLPPLIGNIGSPVSRSGSPMGQKYKKIYNQIGHDESFETGFGQIGEGHVDSVPCKFKVKLTFGAQ